MPNNQKGSTLIILAVLVLLILVGGGAYYLGTQKNTPQESQNSYQPSANPSPSTISQASSSAQISQIPSTWTYQKNNSCSVQIPIPPKAEPYTTNTFPEGGAASDNNRYWQFAENTPSNMLIFQDDAMVSYSPVESNELGNDYNPGSVSVYCSLNSNNLSTDQIISILEDRFKKQQMDFKVINKGSENKWGIDTRKINLDGGMFGDTPIYIFTANDRMYFVYSSSASMNQSVKDTTKQIFDNLKFSN